MIKNILTKIVIFIFILNLYDSGYSLAPTSQIADIEKKVLESQYKMGNASFIGNKEDEINGILGKLEENLKSLEKPNIFFNISTGIDLLSSHIDIRIDREHAERIYAFSKMLARHERVDIQQFGVRLMIELASTRRVRLDREALQLISIDLPNIFKELDRLTQSINFMNTFNDVSSLYLLVELVDVQENQEFLVELARIFMIRLNELARNPNLLDPFSRYLFSNLINSLHVLDNIVDKINVENKELLKDLELELEKLQPIVQQDTIKVEIFVLINKVKIKLGHKVNNTQRIYKTLYLKRSSFPNPEEKEDYTLLILNLIRSIRDMSDLNGFSEQEDSNIISLLKKFFIDRDTLVALSLGQESIMAACKNRVFGDLKKCKKAERDLELKKVILPILLIINESFGLLDQKELKEEIDYVIKEACFVRGEEGNSALQFGEEVQKDTDSLYMFVFTISHEIMHRILNKKKIFYGVSGLDSGALHESFGDLAGFFVLEFVLGEVPPDILHAILDKYDYKAREQSLSKMLSEEEIRKLLPYIEKLKELGLVIEDKGVFVWKDGLKKKDILEKLKTIFNPGEIKSIIFLYMKSTNLSLGKEMHELARGLIHKLLRLCDKRWFNIGQIATEDEIVRLDDDFFDFLDDIGFIERYEGDPYFMKFNNQLYYPQVSSMEKALIIHLGPGEDKNFEVEIIDENKIIVRLKSGKKYEFTREKVREQLVLLEKAHNSISSRQDIQSSWTENFKTLWRVLEESYAKKGDIKAHDILRSFEEQRGTIYKTSGEKNNCAIHAVFGVWNPRRGEYFADNAPQMRNALIEFLDALRNDLQKLIRDYIRAEKIDPLRGSPFRDIWPLVIESYNARFRTNIGLHEFTEEMFLRYIGELRPEKNNMLLLTEIIIIAMLNNTRIVLWARSPHGDIIPHSFDYHLPIELQRRDLSSGLSGQTVHIYNGGMGYARGLFQGMHFARCEPFPPSRYISDITTKGDIESQIQIIENLIDKERNPAAIFMADVLLNQIENDIKDMPPGDGYIEKIIGRYKIIKEKIKISKESLGIAKDFIFSMNNCAIDAAFGNSDNNYHAPDAAFMRLALVEFLKRFKRLNDITEPQMRAIVLDAMRNEFPVISVVKGDEAFINDVDLYQQYITNIECGRMLCAQELSIMGQLSNTVIHVWGDDRFGPREIEVYRPIISVQDWLDSGRYRPAAPLSWNFIRETHVYNAGGEHFINFNRELGFEEAVNNAQINREIDFELQMEDYRLRAFSLSPVQVRGEPADVCSALIVKKEGNSLKFFIEDEEVVLNNNELETRVDLNFQEIKYLKNLINALVKLKQTGVLEDKEDFTWKFRIRDNIPSLGFTYYGGSDNAEIQVHKGLLDEADNLVVQPRLYEVLIKEMLLRSSQREKNIAKIKEWLSSIEKKEGVEFNEEMIKFMSGDISEVRYETLLRLYSYHLLEGIFPALRVNWDDYEMAVEKLYRKGILMKDIIYKGEEISFYKNDKLLLRELKKGSNNLVDILNQNILTDTEVRMAA